MEVKSRSQVRRGGRHAHHAPASSHEGRPAARHRACPRAHARARAAPAPARCAHRLSVAARPSPRARARARGAQATIPHPAPPPPAPPLFRAAQDPRDCCSRSPSADPSDPRPVITHTTRLAPSAPSEQSRDRGGRGQLGRPCLHRPARRPVGRAGSPRRRPRGDRPIVGHQRRHKRPPSARGCRMRIGLELATVSGWATGWPSTRRGSPRPETRTMRGGASASRESRASRRVMLPYTPRCPRG